MKSFRLKQMEQYILDNDTVSMDQLCEKFGISMNTVRIDVAELVKKGTVKKVYGGVCSGRTNSLIPFEERKLRHMEAKKAIGRQAASYVEDGDIIYIDTGSTTLHMVEHLKERRNVIILTNSLEVINSAVPYTNLDVIVLAGKLERNTNSLIAADTAQVLGRYNIKKAFLAATGISLSGGITNSSLLEFEIKKAAVADCDQAFLLADSSKFGRATLMTYTSLDQMDRIITDTDANEGLLELCERFGVKIDLAGSDESN